MVLALTFWVVGGLTFRRLRRWRTANPDLAASPAALARRKRLLRGFGVLFGAEAVLMTVAIGICFALGAPDWIIPSCVLVMGAHFIPFAPLYQRRFDYLPAAWAMAGAIVGLCLLAFSSTDPVTVNGIMCVLSATATSAYGIYGIVQIRRTPLEATTPVD